MDLRPYQNDALDQIRDAIRKKIQKHLLVLATGAGKTVVFCTIVRGAVERGKRAGILVRGRKLVAQASERLFREGVHHGVMMASHWNYRPSHPIQVMSVDTMISRGFEPPLDFLIVDEAHFFNPDSAGGNIIKRYAEKGTLIISCTATPWPGFDLNHLGDHVIHPIKMQELIDQNFLVGFRYFAPDEPDMSGVKKVQTKDGYDFNNRDTEDRMTRGHLTGNIIDHWAKIAENRPTIAFAVNVHHSKILVEKFNSMGIRAEHCDADTRDKERNEIIKRLERGTTKVVSNVGILCTGVDIPCLGAIVMARPTASYNLYVQQTGRGTRLFENKRDCIILDHAGNIKRHGFPTMEPEITLDGKFRAPRNPVAYKICKQCFGVYSAKDCPYCGFKPPEKEKKEIIEGEGRLTEINVTAKNPIEQWLEYLEQQRKKNGRKNGWQFYKLIEKFPFEDCKPYLPRWFIDRFETSNSDNPFAGSPFSGWSGGG